MAKEMWELTALVLFSLILLADSQGMDRLCFTDPQVSQYCAGMESYKYFFDEKTGQCLYKLGCAFSGFTTMTQCKKECVCRQPISEGAQVGGPNCEQEIMRWMAVGEVCVQKPYTGCGGNGNNFRTQSECQTACNPRELESMMGFDLPSFNEMPFALPPGSFGSGMANPGLPASGGHGPPTRRPNNAPGMAKKKSPPRKGRNPNNRRPPPRQNKRPPPPNGNRPPPPNGNRPPPPQNRRGPPNPNRQPHGPPNGGWQHPPPNWNRQPPPPHGPQNQGPRGHPPPQRQGPPPPWARNGPNNKRNPARPNGPNANPNLLPQRQPNAPPQRQPNYPPPQQNSRPNYPPPQNNSPPQRQQQQQWRQPNQPPPRTNPQSNFPPNNQLPNTKNSVTQIPPITSPLPDYPSSTSGWSDPFSWMFY